jgi:hypothetical protein
VRQNRLAVGRDASATTERERRLERLLAIVAELADSACFTVNNKKSQRQQTPSTAGVRYRTERRLQKLLYDCRRRVVMTDSASPSVLSPNISFPEWQADYQAALVELDPEKLPKRVETAETAIFKRLQTLSGNQGSYAERQAIEDALGSLRLLKRENLRFPDWKT